MEEGLFPIFRASDNESELEGERRLCYVAITRAQKLLFITHAKIRTIYGNTSYSLPSRFIDEIPKDLITTTEESSNLGNNKRRLVNIIDRTKRRKNNTVKSQENKDKVQVGTKVNHKKWGIGTVVQIINKDEDKEIVIAFNEPIGLNICFLLLP